MPVQHTLFGLNLPTSRHMPPRRILIVFGLVAFFAASTILFTVPSSLSAVPSVAHLSDSAKDAAQHIHRPKLPNLTVPSIHIPFRQTAHEPPVQKNSTSGEAKWFSDWKWLNPFSSSITLDENRSVLPPLRERPPIYTFYDSANKDDATSAAENKLLLIWRRAWWAQGFQPVVLGRAEAMNNPLYEGLQIKTLDSALEAEIVRWLAWGHMGTGILANWLAVPMGPYEDHLLSYLRRGDYPKLTRYESLGSGLFSGDKISINSALKQALQNLDLKNFKTFIDALPSGTFEVDPQPPESIAFYDLTTIKSRYEIIAEKRVKSQSGGLNALSQLINSHLHTTFQNSFTKGIAVLKPLPAHTTALVEPALQLATLLAQCPETPVASSCPPNRPKCSPCDTAHPMQISTTQIFRNTSSLYTIGTVPHPYTLASLIAQRDKFDSRHIRRETERDPWLLAVTKELLGIDIGGPARVVRFKEAVAGVWSSAHSLWLTAEKDIIQKELDWHFGFSIPRMSNATARINSNTPVPGSGDLPPPPEPTAKELEMEKELLVKAREALKSKERPRIGIREVVEAWNLADTEAWRFVRAYRARAKVERLKWEEKEKKFAGAERTEGGGWGRWFDRER